MSQLRVSSISHKDATVPAIRLKADQSVTFTGEVQFDGPAPTGIDVPVDSVNGKTGAVELALFDLTDVANDPGFTSTRFRYNIITYSTGTDQLPAGSYDAPGECGIRNYYEQTFFNPVDADGVNAFPSLPDYGFGYGNVWFSYDEGQNWTLWNNVQVSKVGDGTGAGDYFRITANSNPVREQPAGLTSILVAFEEPVTIPPGVKEGGYIKYDASSSEFVAGPFNESIFALRDVINDQTALILDFNTVFYEGPDQAPTMPDDVNAQGKGVVQISGNAISLNPTDSNGVSLATLLGSAQPFKRKDFWLSTDGGTTYVKAAGYYDYYSQATQAAKASPYTDGSDFYIYIYSFNPALTNLLTTPSASTPGQLKIALYDPGVPVLYQGDILMYDANTDSNPDGKNQFKPTQIPTSVNGQTGPVSLGLSQLNDVDVGPSVSLYTEPVFVFNDVETSGGALEDTALPGAVELVPNANLFLTNEVDSNGRDMASALSGNPETPVWISLDGGTTFTEYTCWPRNDFDRCFIDSVILADGSDTFGNQWSVSSPPTSVQITFSQPASSEPVLNGDLLAWDATKQLWVPSHSGGGGSGATRFVQENTVTVTEGSSAATTFDSAGASGTFISVENLSNSPVIVTVYASDAAFNADVTRNPQTTAPVKGDGVLLEVGFTGQGESLITPAVPYFVVDPTAPLKARVLSTSNGNSSLSVEIRLKGIKNEETAT